MDWQGHPQEPANRPPSFAKVGLCGTRAGLGQGLASCAQRQMVPVGALPILSKPILE